MNTAAIKEIIDEYKSLRISHPDTWLIDCKNAKSIQDCIKMAGTSRNAAGKKHPHQYRIQNQVLFEFSERLLSDQFELLKSKNFSELYDKVRKHKIKGVGLLTLYDTTHRIGKMLNLNPDKVYLHRGAKIGAEKLLQKRIKTHHIEKSDLNMFDELTCSEIEDILCLSKGEINNTKCLFKVKEKIICT